MAKVLKNAKGFLFQIHSVKDKDTLKDSLISFHEVDEDQVENVSFPEGCVQMSVCHEM